MMKKCSTCGSEKPSKAFQVRRMSKDGLTASCKECLKARDKARYEDDPKRKEYCKGAPKRYVASARKARGKYNEKHPDRIKVNSALSNAVRDGKIKKPEHCEVCEEKTRLHGHHHDYSKPLDVWWLCVPCHKHLHVLTERVNG